jgi:hypothetical protein
MPETRGKYEQEFRAGSMSRSSRKGAVRIFRASGKTIAQIARDPDINPGTLRNWVAKEPCRTHWRAGNFVWRCCGVQAIAGRKSAAADGARCFAAILGSVAEGGDEVSVARFIAGPSKRR